MHTMEDIIRRMSSQGLRITDQRKTLAKTVFGDAGLFGPEGSL